MSATNSATPPREERLKRVAEVLGEDALRVLSPEECDPSKRTEEPAAPKARDPASSFTRCATDPGRKPRPRNMLEHKPKDDMFVNIGIFDHIPRWKKGSIIKWVAYSGGYDTPADAVYAAQEMRRAAARWNGLNFGLKFEQISDPREANFGLGYGGQPASRYGVLAEAYFPSNDDFSDIIVYALQFTPEWKPKMYNTFLHELGHVIGLRHEHANSPDPEWFEGGAVLLGEENPISIMAYDQPDPAEIQDSDVRGVKAFYDLADKQIVGNMKVMLFEPQ